MVNLRYRETPKRFHACDEAFLCSAFVVLSAIGPILFDWATWDRSKFGVMERSDVQQKLGDDQISQHDHLLGLMFN